MGEVELLQPRGQGAPVQSWECTYEDIIKHMREMDAAISSSKLEAPPTAIGTHCKFCNAKLICPAMAAAERSVSEWDHRDIPPEQLGEMLVKAQAVEMMVKDLFTYCYDRIAAGEKIPGWKLTVGRKTRAWKDPDALMKWAKRNGKMTKLFEKKLRSPAQAAKVMKDDVDSLNRFIETRESKPSLKPADAPGEEVQSPMAGLAALGQRLSN